MRSRQPAAFAVSLIACALWCGLAAPLRADEASEAAAPAQETSAASAVADEMNAALLASEPAASAAGAPETGAPDADAGAPAAEADSPDAASPETDEARTTGASGTASTLDHYDPLYDEEDAGTAAEGVHDPLEPVNRALFRFNRGLDIVLFDPITKGYRLLVPAPARRSIERAFVNLNSPVVFANLVMQGRGRDAAIAVGRFVANTTLGVAGLFDYANDVIGWHRTDADFGQTLGVYGVTSGPYLVLPVFGPSTLRDACGSAADLAMNPLTYWFAPLQLQWTLLFGGSQGLSHYEANADALDALRDASVDFYAALRSAYTQSREGAVKEAREARTAP
jgi:phospholipid-binding lipoprotein MlaA